MKNKRIFPLFIITLSYFLLGIINMTAAFSMLICMGLPFVLVIKNRQKTWCKGLCPRADFFRLFSKTGLKRKSPSWMTGRNMKKGILLYFGISLLFITLSSFMVALGKKPVMENLRLFIAIPVPVKIPQLVVLNGWPSVLTHLSYRFYSLMLSSTLLGTAMALLFKPRTWCAVCPVNQLSGTLLKGLKKAERSTDTKSLKKAG